MNTLTKEELVKLYQKNRNLADGDMQADMICEQVATEWLRRGFTLQDMLQSIPETYFDSELFEYLKS